MEIKKNLIINRGRKGNGVLSVLLLVLIFFGACSQDAIFYNIAQEVELLDPRISGTPTNIVFFDGNIYVANRSSLHRYKRPAPDQDPVWDNPVQPGDDIRGLAATGGYLYALTGGSLKRLSQNNAAAGGDWEPVNIDTADTIAAGYPVLQSIYADSGLLFAGSGNGVNSYAILYADETENKLKGLKDNVSLLTGAVFSNAKHFLATAGSGIYAVPDPLPPGPFGDPVPGSADQEITGLITLDNGDVVAARRGGDILRVTGSGFTVLKGVGYRTTGALALWRSPPVPNDPADPDAKPSKLLLVGIQGSTSSTSQTYTNGYREIFLNETDGSLPDDFSAYTPGDSPAPSITNREKYATSLGELPINYLFQIPHKLDPNMTLFASTHKDGLWSYRQRSGDWQWNAEE
jgi:hypothetical protein